MKNNTETLIGIDNNFLDALEKVSRLAKIARPVLICGERGTGKELFAHRLHYLSPRWDEPFIALNCAALNDNLLDSELFGHESGAFTGAQRRHQGRFERADGGTLFLDELGTAPLTVQEKLLRVIEYGEFERVGGQQTLKADVRIVCATNADLPALAAEGKFRADLLDRLAFDVVNIPPLRERPRDLTELAGHFAVQMCQEMGTPFFAGFSPHALQQMQSYHWPGNIRELKNVIERSLYRQGDTTGLLAELVINPFVTTQSHAPDTGEPPLPPLPFSLKQWQHTQEKDALDAALQRAQFNQREAAQLLNLTYHQFRGLLKKHAGSPQPD
ncbi:phage shock protein operon transcriptional activator [Morganella morganii]|uniref:Phage shock protein operon transcriptional activator n=1 Tax=Morganella morganii TaxID=582 RepID=A0A9Q4CT20_MORMO|nr:phage shock protein operon transcriptional activator [Morganella morganii]HDU8309842.1 phage shock protein operon transcriptional activator [Morganella morganii subsp. sibonii]EGT3622724.1 phage shock protein operon transcriptional activator [Morganella morganii]EGT3632144.1 phage shock protein operon transcriptional activator [Morganella morganii]EGT3635379.1 phage shock protein operon transcriptional activator [Morganella morganii]EJD6039505.1 phage shock protein operon transcriptional ac